jgi:hypothetical protein
MGAYDFWGTEDPSDDRIAAFSSRGPSPGGRKKPDLAALGVTMYADRRWADPGHGLWAGSDTGTSWAAPQAGGAAALLAGSGISDPAMQKAILINSARLGRATPSDPMGTQTGWQPDWGWGALNLDQALAERTNGAPGSVPGNSARFFRASAVASGDRTTLVWHRRVGLACYSWECPAQPFPLTNLDLQQLDPSTGAVLTQSNSAIDNVEQVRSPGAAATAIYKVKATSSVDGLSAEPFAVTARRALTPLATPQPTVTLNVAAGTQRAGQTATVTATVRNPSDDLTAENASVALELPAGVELVNGEQTRNLGTLATDSAPQTFTWTVKGTTDGLKDVIARAEASRYGETFTGTATDSFTVDETGPAPTLATPAGRTADSRLPVTWGATDAYSPVTTYDVEASIDGGAWGPWLAATNETQGTYSASSGHRYRFRVRATDSLGNVSSWVESGETTVNSATSGPPPTGNPTPTNPTPPTPAKSSAALGLAAVKRSGSTIRISGKVASGATGRVFVTYSARVGRKTYKTRATAASLKRGRFTATLKLPAKLRKVRRGTLEIRYAGDSNFAAQTLKRTVTAR